MIIILSPAKTFNKNPSPYDTIPIFENEANILIDKLKKVSIKRLESSMHLSHQLALDVHEDYLKFGHTKTAAIHGYNGHQYRHLDILSIEHLGAKDQAKSIYILSGLYGLVNAYDGISPYRLEMKDKTVRNLYLYWKPKISKWLNQLPENEVIYNLASDEYGRIIKDDKRVITVQFFEQKNQRLSIHSMMAKSMRGLFARHLILNPHDDVKQIEINDFKFDKTNSDDRTLTYIRK